MAVGLPPRLAAAVALVALADSFVRLCVEMTP